MTRSPDAQTWIDRLVQALGLQAFPLASLDIRFDREPTHPPTVTATLCDRRMTHADRRRP